MKKVFVVTYFERGMDERKYVGNTVDRNGKTLFVTLEGHTRDHPHPGDLFHSARGAKEHFEFLGFDVEIPAQQGSI